MDEDWYLEALENDYDPEDLEEESEEIFLFGDDDF